ncbi:Gfo/Idh/MocA family oxidoreductase [Nesterenkonia sp. HG001]|uniref:Gfo/Idh/MocA family protein n=1 Tax=Nesterenkonia sp. HG001 TaxID=2983207 RepID=UPI002AC520B9|nr:Gfo/Idh/MocA family oxidoreductase [Nesterenkonia sp. HG001]MDZ5076147.1 Gfo/Idh/MocA family oxidoreductase [Nesterenkonia sp. HG001]
MQKLKAGIIGGGFMARTHTAAARAAGADVVGLVSSSPDRSTAAAEPLGVTPASSVEELIERSDVVHVCSPNARHAEHVRAVLRAGRHVICEKPLAVDAAEAAELAELAESAGVVASVPFVYRFHPMARQARSETSAGRLGRLLTVRGAYLQDWLLDAEESNWRVDPQVSGRSRAFGDIGSHLVDLLEFITGERIVRLSAATTIAHPQRGGAEVVTEDAAALTVELTGGALGSLMVSQVNAGRKNQLTLELSGAEGSVFFDQEHPDELWLGRADGSVTIARDPAVMDEDAARLSLVPSGHPMGYLDAFAAFARDTYARIGGEQPAGLPTFADGARANRIIDAVLESAQSGRWVDVAPSERPVPART